MFDFLKKDFARCLIDQSDDRSDKIVRGKNWRQSKLPIVYKRLEVLELRLRFQTSSGCGFWDEQIWQGGHGKFRLNPARGIVIKIIKQERL